MSLSVGGFYPLDTWPEDAVLAATFSEHTAAIATHSLFFFAEFCDFFFLLLILFPTESVQLLLMSWRISKEEEEDLLWEQESDVCTERKIDYMFLKIDDHIYIHINTEYILKTQVGI